MAGGDGPAVTTVDAAARATAEAVWRIEAARIVGSLARLAGDFGLAEDVARGSSAASGDDWIRHGLAREALRLGRVLVRLHPAADAYGLLALMELTAARFPAREDADGRPVLLEDQDGRRWACCCTPPTCAPTLRGDRPPPQGCSPGRRLRRPGSTPARSSCQRVMRSRSAGGPAPPGG